MKKIFYFILVLVISSCSVEVTETPVTAAGTSDGTASAPVQLTLGTAKSGATADWGYSYYKFDTPATGAGDYKLEIGSIVYSGSTSSEVTMYLYSDSSYSTTKLIDYESCAASCTLNFDYDNLDAGKTYYLKTFGSYYYSATYNFTVSKAGNSEGSKNNPVDLTLATAHSGTIANIAAYTGNGKSYYKFTTVAADNYTMTMTNSASLDCELYSDSTFTTNVSWSNNDCTAGANLTQTFTGVSSTAGLAANTSYYIKIKGVATTVVTTTYNITVAAEGN